MTTERHLTSEEVATYLDNTLSDTDRARVKAHLADCDACRQEIVSVSKLLEGAPRSRRRFVALSAMAAAAAVLVVFLVRPSTDSELPAAGGQLRRGDTPFASEGVSRVRALAPIGPQSDVDRIVFVWHPTLPGAVYRLTLTDDRGDKILVRSTNDTTLVIPDDTSPLKAGSYHWYVDVLQPDGSSATTGVTSFQVVR